MPLRHNGTPYRIVNVLSLWLEGTAHGYASPTWMTFKQALDLGGCVRKGEKGTLTVYADAINRAETDEATGEERTTKIPFMKGYTVFNVEQIVGLPEQYRVKPAPRAEALPRIERAEAFFTSTKACIRHGGNRAYYAEGSDHIRSSGKRPVAGL